MNYEVALQIAGTDANDLKAALFDIDVFATYMDKMMVLPGANNNIDSDIKVVYNFAIYLRRDTAVSGMLFDMAIAAMDRLRDKVADMSTYEALFIGESGFELLRSLTNTNVLKRLREYYRWSEKICEST